MRCAVLLALPAAMSACGGVGNQPPTFLTFNGADVGKDFWGVWWVDATFGFAPGDTIPFEVAVSDPEGQDVLLWWPKAPPGFDFPPDGRTGTWAVPVDFAATWWTFTLIARDDGDEPEASVLTVDFGAGWDTGW